VRSRPKTPTTPSRNGGDDSLSSINTDGMDVRRLDPEKALVGFEIVEAGDISADLDPSTFSGSAQDKVGLETTPYHPDRQLGR